MVSSRLLSLDEAVALVRERDSIGLPLGPGLPSAFLHQLATRPAFEELDVFGALLTDLYEVFTRPGVRYRSGFFGPAERFLLASGARVEFVPSDFRRFAPLLERLKPRVMAALAAPPDADGYMSLSLHSGANTAELRAAAADPDRVCLIEINAKAPRTVGTDEYPHRLHVSEVDVIVESDRPLFVLADAPVTEVEAAIASHVARFVHDGATLQTGIGGVPSAVVGQLAEGPGGDYGVHSEMFTTALMKLHKSGKVSNQRKGQFEGYSVATFAAGTEELYAWLDNNSDVRFLPVGIVNAPEVIAANTDMVSINGALGIDLYGQVMADSIGGVQFSGIGGHEDFVAMSGIELSDRSIICLPSTSTVAGELLSRIDVTLGQNAIVTTPRHQLDVVVTEYGAAELRGLTVRERAVALASIAHPAFRERLLAAANTLG